MTSVVKPFSPKMLITLPCSCVLRYICLLAWVQWEITGADLAWEKHHLVRHCTQAWFCEVSRHDKTIILCKTRIQLFLLAWNIKRFWDFEAYSCKGQYSGSEDHITSSVFNSLYFSVFWLNERQCIKTEYSGCLETLLLFQLHHLLDLFLTVSSLGAGDKGFLKSSYSGPLISTHALNCQHLS